MFTIELHRPRRGTLLPSLIRQAEVRDIANFLEQERLKLSLRQEARWTRAYIMRNGVLLQIIERQENDTLRSVAYAGEALLRLPRAYGSTGLAVQKIESATAPARARSWATTELKKPDISAACLLQNGQLVAAYERVKTETQTMAVSSLLIG